MNKWEKALKDPETTWLELCAFHQYLSALSKEERKKVLNEKEQTH